MATIDTIDELPEPALGMPSQEAHPMSLESIVLVVVIVLIVLFVLGYFGRSRIGL